MLLKIETDSDGNVTFAKGTLIGGPLGNLEAKASSRRHPQDKHRSNLGEEIAVGRMLQILGRKMEHRGTGLVKHQDDMLQQKLQQKKDYEAKMDVPLTVLPWAGGKDRGV